MNTKKAIKKFTQAFIISSFVVTSTHAEVLIGNDLNSADSSNEDIANIYSANRGLNGGGDQSLQFGDVIEGTDDNDLIIGGLGIDILFGGKGNDIIIGGTEDFNSFNRDRAFGQEGDDTFLWAPGDGNDFFDGGTGTDVLFLSLIGESTNNTEEIAVATSLTKKNNSAPFFSVNPPNTSGSQDFDGIHEVTPGMPIVNFVNSPGFCEIIEPDEQNKVGLDELGLDHLVRFILRGPQLAAAREIEEGVLPEVIDNGLRVAIHLKNVEFLVCASKESPSQARIFDLREVPAQELDISNLPAGAAALLENSFQPPITIKR